MNKNILTKCLMAMAVILYSLTIQAQSDSAMTIMIEPIQTDRPDQTETSALVPKGFFQMENGFSIEDTEPGFLYTHPSTLWKYGVSDFFEVRVLTEYINIQRAPNPNVDGLLPIQVGIKTRLLKQNGIVPEAAFIGHISLPGIASEQFQQTFFAPNVRLAFSHDIGDRFSVGYNAGAAWDGETPRPEFQYTLAVSSSLVAGLGIFGEVYGSVPQQREEEAEWRVDAGLTYLITDNIQADVSAGMGLSDNAPERFISGGLSYRFKL